MPASPRRTPASLAYEAALKAKRRSTARRVAEPAIDPGPTVDSVVMRLPLPPSVNALTFNRALGRGKTEAYKQWIRDAGWVVASEKPGKVVGPYSLALFLPVSMQGDIDNRLKPTIDLMVSLGVTDDDQLCQRASAARDPAVPAGSCTVRIEAVG